MIRAPTVLDRNSARPLLTVAIPVYNREREVVRMLHSLERQDWSLLEVRFGNDGSEDGTLRVLEAFAGRHPGKAFVESHANMGPGPSRNRLLEQALGEWIWFCDSDDELAPDAVSSISSILARSPCDILAFEYGRGDCPAAPGLAGLGAAPVPETRSQLLLSVLGATVSKVLRTDFLRKHGIAFPPLRAGEDWVFTARAACACEAALFWSAKPYWARNGFWSASNVSHLTRNVDEPFCRSLCKALDMLSALQGKHPESRMEIGVIAWNLASHLRSRVRDAAPPPVREKWLPAAEDRLREMAASADNPLLRIPKGATKRESALARARLELDAARKTASQREREARERERVATVRARRALRRERAMRHSLSWRITAPLRIVGRLFTRSGPRHAGKA